MNFVMLPHEQWHLVAPIVREEFDDPMPVDSLQTNFLAALDGEKLAAFVRVERIYHFVNEYTAPDYRGTGLTRQVFEQAARIIPPNFSGIWMTDGDRGTFAKGLGARQVVSQRPDGTWFIYRKDC